MEQIQADMRRKDDKAKQQWERHWKEAKDQQMKDTQVVLGLIVDSKELVHEIHEIRRTEDVKRKERERQ